MSDKPSAAWYLAPIFLGIIGSAIMWYVLKDEDHPDSPKMIKKGWVIGIVLTLIPLLMMIPMLILMPMTAMNDFDGMGDHMEVIPDPIVQMVPAPGFEDVPEMIVEEDNERMVSSAMPWMGLNCDEMLDFSGSDEHHRMHDSMHMEFHQHYFDHCSEIEH